MYINKRKHLINVADEMLNFAHTKFGHKVVPFNIHSSTATEQTAITVA